MKRAIGVAQAAIAVLAFGTVEAKELSATDFSLRLQSAFAKFSPYGDVAGVGGASAGSKYSSGINPASTDWDRVGKTEAVAGIQYSAIPFARGPTLHVPVASVIFSVPNLGSFQPAVAHIASDGSRNDDFVLFNGEYAQLQWSKRLGDAAVGANFNYTKLRLAAGTANLALTTSESDTFDGRLGLLYQVSSSILGGLVLDYAAAPSDSIVFDPTCFCGLPISDTGKQILVRPGLTWEYAEQSSVYLDYQYAHFWSGAGGYTNHRLFSGVEQRIFEWLFVRAGAAFDPRAGTTATAGIGVYPTKQISIDFAFQGNAFPELRPEYGSNRLFAVSASWAF
jgi:hypothetical protein